MISCGWIRRAIEEKKGALFEEKVMRQIVKTIADQVTAEQAKLTNTIDLLQFQRLKGVEIESGFKTVADMLNAVRDTGGFYYYVARSLELSASHAMAFRIGTKNGTDKDKLHYFLDPNPGLYEFTDFDKMVSGVSKHLVDEKYKKYFGKAAEHSIFRILSVIPKDSDEAKAARPPSDENTVDLVPVIQFFKPSAPSQRAACSEAMIAHWLKRWGTKQSNKVEAGKFRPDDLNTILNIMKQAALVDKEPAADRFKKIMNAAEMPLNNQLLYESVRLGSELRSPEDSVMKPLTNVLKFIVETKSTRLLLRISAEIISAKQAELKKTKDLLVIAIVRAKASEYYFLDSKPQLVTINSEEKEVLARHLAGLLINYRNLAVEAYSF